MLISSNLGETAAIGRIKLSWLFGFMLFLSISLIYYKDTYYFFINNSSKKACLIFVIFWLSYALIQSLFSMNRALSFKFLIIVAINCLIIFTVIIQSKTVSDALFYNKAMILSLLINIIIAVWEIRTGNHVVKLDTENDILFYSKMPHGVFGNVNDFATFLYFGIISIFIDIIYNHRHYLYKIVLIIVSLLLIILTNSRAVLYGSLAFLLLFPIIYYLINHLQKGIFELLPIVGSFLIILVLSKYPLYEIIDRFSSSGNRESDLLRLDLIKKSFEVFIRSFLLGAGPGQSTNYLGTNPHNFFLEILADYGLIIFTGVSIMLLIIFYSFLKIRNTKLASLNISFCISFLLVSISSSSANRIRATWIIISILLSLVFSQKETIKVSRSE